MNEDNFKKFIQTNTQIELTTPTNEFANIMDKIDESKNKASWWSFKNLSLAATAASLILALYIGNSYQTQHQDDELAAYLNDSQSYFDDSLDDDAYYSALIN